MAKSKKRDLTEDEANKASILLTQKHVSLGRVAKLFGVNKPAILKAVGAWNTDIQKAPDGKEFKMVKGKVVVIPNKEEPIKGQGFQIR